MRQIDFIVKNSVSVTQVEQGDRRTEKDKWGQFTWIKKIPTSVTVLS